MLQQAVQHDGKIRFKPAQRQMQAAGTAGRGGAMLDNNPHYSAISEAFPHIGHKLKLYWGHQDFVRYMQELMHDTRNGQRRGFPFEIALALTSLSDDHRQLFPNLYPSDDIWTLTHMR